MYNMMLFVTMIMLILQYSRGYSKTCSVDPTSDVVENAALNRPASQISNYRSWSVASKAVDGNNNPVFTGGSCSHTKSNDPRLYRWWMVDLEREYRIDSVNITNRLEYPAAKKLRDFEIFVSLNSTLEADGHMVDAFLCFNVSGGMVGGETRTFTCQTPVFGQFVQIYMETPNLRNMHLCEVTVQGYPAICVADVTTQSVPNMPPTIGSEGTSLTTPPLCPCLCKTSSTNAKTLTQEALVELVKELAKELTVNKKETSLSKRKLISVGDERQSAETIGFIGVLSPYVPVLLIVSFDLINLCSFLKKINGRKTLK